MMEGAVVVGGAVVRVSAVARRAAAAKGDKLAVESRGVAARRGAVVDKSVAGVKDVVAGRGAVDVVASVVPVTSTCRKSCRSKGNSMQGKCRSTSKR